MHFHPHQEEYIEILHGKLCVDIEDEEHMLEDGSGELSVKPWTNHRLYPPEDFGGESIIRFFLSAESTSELFQLDTLFFENWYRYQEEVVSAGKSLDMLQVISVRYPILLVDRRLTSREMFDAGGSYLTLPRMVPFRGYVSQALSIVVGRWIGSIFGYQPFYKLWSGDWDVARKKMASSYFQRKFAVKSISCE